VKRDKKQEKGKEEKLEQGRRWAKAGPACATDRISLIRLRPDIFATILLIDQCLGFFLANSSLGEVVIN